MKSNKKLNYKLKRLKNDLNFIEKKYNLEIEEKVEELEEEEKNVEEELFNFLMEEIESIKKSNIKIFVSENKDDINSLTPYYKNLLLDKIKKKFFI